jgi:hypothetical protein
VGVVSYLSGSEQTCYADSCCERAQDQTDIRIQSDIPCCNLDIHVAPENSRTLLPNHKYGQATPLADTPSRFDASRPEIRIVSALPFISLFHASINLPLRI